jgi:hypothetical protein
MGPADATCPHCAAALDPPNALVCINCGFYLRASPRRDPDTPTIHEVPAPWRSHVYAVGGLFGVGYATASDLLLVLSSQGRGVFDCSTGKKLNRDYEEAHDFFDPIRLVAVGFGPLAGQSIRIAGLFGGGLPLTTRDGWHLQAQARVWPTHSVFLTAPSSQVPVCIAEDGACELRAYGFSETCGSFIIATSCELAMFTRLAAPVMAAEQ